jgi:hypothetical protein
MVTCSEPDCEVKVDHTTSEDSPEPHSKFCPNHRCEEEGCVERRSDTIEEDTIEEGHRSELCETHECKFPGCTFYRKDWDADTEYCGDHQCDVPDCKRVRYINTLCRFHLCKREGCNAVRPQNRFVMELQPFCPGHTCCVLGCQGERLDSPSPDTCWCLRHTCHEKGCWEINFDGTTDRIGDNTGFCDDHRCFYGGCHKPRAKWAWVPLWLPLYYCLEHTCRRLNCCTIIAGTPDVSRFCEVHTCEANGCWEEKKNNNRFGVRFCENHDELEAGGDEGVA